MMKLKVSCFVERVGAEEGRNGCEKPCVTVSAYKTDYLFEVLTRNSDSFVIQIRLKLA